MLTFFLGALAFYLLIGAIAAGIAVRDVYRGANENREFFAKHYPGVKPSRVFSAWYELPLFVAFIMIIWPLIFIGSILNG
jgi:hypothetical protein